MEHLAKKLITLETESWNGIKKYQVFHDLKCEPWWHQWARHVLQVAKRGWSLAHNSLLYLLITNSWSMLVYLVKTNIWNNRSSQVIIVIHHLAVSYIVELTLSKMLRVNLSMAFIVTGKSGRGEAVIRWCWHVENNKECCHLSSHWFRLKRLCVFIF